jgi:membrane protease YdiL (CAAX protease family)
MNGINLRLKTKFPRASKWIALALSSAMFGLMHYPRETELADKIAYCAFATIAGVFYGLGYIYSANIFAPTIIHCLTDTFWLFFFQPFQ